MNPRAKPDTPDWLLPNIHRLVPERYAKEVETYAKSKNVTIYRAVGPKDPTTEIQPGDWVALTHSYAKYHGGISGGVRILKKRVPASHVSWAGTDMNEWFYTPGNWEESQGPFETQVEQLCELLDAPYELEWEYDGESADFRTPVGKFTVEFSREDWKSANAGSPDLYADNFSDALAKLGLHRLPNLSFVFDETYFEFVMFDFRDQQNKFSVTGRGGPVVSKIFATVAKAFEKFMADNNPDCLYFVADEPSRKRLYQSFVRRVPGWIKNSYHILVLGGGTMFAFFNKAAISNVKRKAQRLIDRGVIRGVVESKNQRLQEGRIITPPGLKTRVLENPTFIQAKRMFERSKFKSLRGLLSRWYGDFYLWDAIEGFHKSVSDAVGLDWFGDVVYNDGRLHIDSLGHLRRVFDKIEKGGVKNYNDTIV